MKDPIDIREYEGEIVVDGMHHGEWSLSPSHTSGVFLRFRGGPKNLMAYRVSWCEGNWQLSNTRTCRITTRDGTPLVVKG